MPGFRAGWAGPRAGSKLAMPKIRSEVGVFNRTWKSFRYVRAGEAKVRESARRRCFRGWFFLFSKRVPARRGRGVSFDLLLGASFQQTLNGCRIYGVLRRLGLRRGFPATLPKLSASRGAGSGCGPAGNSLWGVSLAITGASHSRLLGRQVAISGNCDFWSSGLKSFFLS